jgi:hypothetical protein
MANAPTAKSTEGSMDDPAVANALYWLSWMPLLRNIAAAIVVVGVALEFAEGWLSDPWRKIVDDAKELQIAQLTKAGDEARAAIAGANERAAEANQKAQEASLELAKFKAPRVLNEEQRGRIVDKLKPQFSGTEYDITIIDSEPEILNLVFAIELVLSTAEWTELDWKGTGEALIRAGKQPLIRLGVSIANVVIGVQVNQPPKLFEAALALSDALATEGITATAERHIGHEMSSTNENAIHIMIGRKL